MKTLFAGLVTALALLLVLGGNVTRAQDAPKKEGDAPKKEAEKKLPDRPRGGAPDAPGEKAPGEKAPSTEKAPEKAPEPSKK